MNPDFCFDFIIIIQIYIRDEIMIKCLVFKGKLIIIYTYVYVLNIY